MNVKHHGSGHAAPTDELRAIWNELDLTKSTSRDPRVTDSPVPVPRDWFGRMAKSIDRLAAPAPTQQPTEHAMNDSATYWMVEHYDYNSGHKWLRIVLMGTVNDIPRASLDWTADPQIAMHFSRQQDAEAFALMHPEWTTLCKVTSHSDAGVAVAPDDLQQQAAKVCGYLGTAYDGEPRRVIEALVARAFGGLPSSDGGQQG